MSDHSHDHEEQNSPISKVIGTIFLIAVPGALIVMLAVTGFAFAKAVQPPGATDKVAQTAAPAAGGAAPAAAEGSAPAANGDQPDAAASGVDQMELGKTAYMNCMACHGADGKGMKVATAMMAPSLAGSELLLGDPDVPLLIVLKGIQKEGMDFMGMMAPLAAALDDEKLAAVLTYTRNSFGNSAPAVTVEQAAAARAKYADVDAPAGIKRAEVLAIVEAHK